MAIIKRTGFSEYLNPEFLREELSRHSAYAWIGLIILALLTFMAVTNSIASKSEGRLVQKEAELTGFFKMLSEYKRDEASIGYLRDKLKLGGVEGSTGAVIEEIAARIGLKKKITSFKPLSDGLMNGYMEKGVEVKIKGVTLNQVVNLLYRIKGYKNLLLIRDFSMKNSFQNPDMLDITIQVMLITRSGGS